MRAQRQEIKLLQEGNADEMDIISARARYRATSAEYARFSKAMDLPQQRERVTVDGLGKIGQGKYKMHKNAVDKVYNSNYNISADKLQFEKYKNIFGSEFPTTFEEFQTLKYHNTSLWQDYKLRVKTKNYLQEQLAYIFNGEKLFIPKNTKFDRVVTIAGDGTETPIRIIDNLIEKYGGEVKDWKKRAGKVTSSKYIFDVHWYEKNGVKYEVKLKHRKERKK